jgi:hypothetical protein
MSEKKTMSKRKTQIIIAIIKVLGLIIVALIPCLIGAQLISRNKKPLSFENWSEWGGISAIPQGNSVTLNGESPMCGYRTEVLNTGLTNKTVILVIENEGSEFNNNRLIKIAVNMSEELVNPLGITPLVGGEYVPVGNARIEFPLPSNFDGNLGFMFTHVKLNNLKITAYYK